MTDYSEYETHEAMVLMGAESAAAAGLFGPPHELLARAVQRIVDPHSDSPQREFVVHESEVASVFVYEPLDAGGDVARFSVELVVDVGDEPFSGGRARQVAALLVAAADEYDRLVSLGIGVAR